MEELWVQQFHPTLTSLPSVVASSSQIGGDEENIKSDQVRPSRIGILSGGV